MVLGIGHSTPHAPVREGRDNANTPPVFRQTEPHVVVSPATPLPNPDSHSSPITPPAPTGSAPGTQDVDAKAEQAFGNLIQFLGLTPDDKTARIAATEDFLKVYGDTTVAARARGLNAELKKNSEPFPTAPQSIPIVSASPIKTPEPVETAKPPVPADRPGVDSCGCSIFLGGSNTNPDARQERYAPRPPHPIATLRNDLSLHR